MTSTPPRPVWPRVTHLAGLVVVGRRKHHCGIVLDRTSRRHLAIKKKTDCGGHMVKIVSYISVFTMSCSGRQTAVLTWCVVR